VRDQGLRLGAPLGLSDSACVPCMCFGVDLRGEEAARAPAHQPWATRTDMCTSTCNRGTWLALRCNVARPQGALPGSPEVQN